MFWDVLEFCNCFNQGVLFCRGNSISLSTSTTDWKTR